MDHASPDGEDILCCSGCRAIDGLWPRLQRARAIMQHRPPTAETVALALRALDGESLAEPAAEEG